MEPKKNPKEDLDKNHGLFFVIGLAFILLVTYIALEWKTYPENPLAIVPLENYNGIGEEVPPIIQITVPPPPPPVAPEIIEIVPDEVPLEETIIKSSEDGQDTKILEVKEVAYDEMEEDVPIPISIVEEAPIFPGCEQEEDQRACFNKMMLKHIQKTFRYPKIPQEMGIQGKVYMNFVIQKDGTIGEIEILRSPDANLGKEAKRIISTLPQMRPGLQSGKPVRVPFSIPITFKLQ